jgi:hypothetical protein
VKGSGFANLRYYLGIYLDGLMKITKVLRRGDLQVEI